ncbi:conserved hypothetical protein [Paecilomyces variotii No. 5]|uniref:Methyltransferase type 11 domain-containing protein n=1 Tax=Byssochlamys spectabilis (strain No. 5 / NBRC 109023) TaxID=1356009 RepID=V5G5K6_BYSSN|nr:conserved hypothetical protein [Paecilomyces variotii No. 5]
MSSYGSDRGQLLRPSEPVTQPRDLRQKAAFRSVTSTSIPVPQSSRSQIVRPAYVAGRKKGTSSASETEDSRPVMTPRLPTPTLLSSNDARPSLIPRPSGGASSGPQRRLSTNLSGPVRSTQPPNVAQTPPVAPEPRKPGSAIKDRPRNVLRRKAPLIGKTPDQTKRLSGLSDVEIFRANMAASTTIPTARQASKLDAIHIKPHRHPEQQQGQVTAVLPSHIPEPQSGKKLDDSSTRAIPKELASLSTHNLPPPTPHFASASSPSTRYSGSPGMWSRGSTPTSLSSYSPGIVQPTKVGYRLRQPSPTQVRLPVPTRPLTASPQTEGINASSIKFRYTDKPQTPDLSTRLNQNVQQRHVAGAKGVSKSPMAPPRKSSVDFKQKKQRGINAVDENQEAERRVEQAERLVFSPRIADETTAQQPTSTPAVPPRPSRKGTDKLELKPSPVIKSNLPYLRTTGHKRRESAEELRLGDQSHPTPSQPAAASVESFQSRSSQQSVLQSHPAKSTRTLTKTPPQDKKAVPSSPSKRFGIFAKKSKSSADSQSASLSDRQARKGPAAGTGHEGYGRYAQRGRRPSVASTNGSRGRSTSTTRSTAKSASSSKSSLHGSDGPEIDDFLLDRLEPVVISGGGMDRAQLLRVRSEQTTGTHSNASTLNLATYGKNAKQGAHSTGSLVPTADRSVQSSQAISSRQDPPKAQKENQAPRSIIGKRISFRRSQIFSGKNEGLPTSTGVIKTDSSALHSLDNAQGSTTSLLPDAQPASSISPDSKAKSKEDRKAKPKPRAKTSRWNFFQRSQAVGHPEPVHDSAKPTTELPVTVAPVPGSRTVPHYALLDTSSDSLDDILHYVEESPPTETEYLESSVDVPAALNIRKQHESILLPSPPLLQAESIPEGRSSPKVYFRNDSQDSGKWHQDTAQNARPSRLASVGRIPPVISRRDRHHKPATQSYSRPFSRADAPSLTVTADDQDQQRYVSNRPALGIQTDVLPSRPFYSEPETAKPFSAPMPATEFSFLMGAYADEQFLAFSPRKESLASGSSSSEGKLSLAAVTAVPPGPGSKPTEDEVWNEYDDLIDDLSPETSNASARNECGARDSFELATKASKTLQAELNAHAPSVTTSDFAGPVQGSARSSAGSVRLRRSTIANALHSSISPNTQVSFSELIGGYAERNTESMDLTPQANPSTLVPGEQPATFLRSPSISRSTSFETCRHRNTVLSDLAERQRQGSIAQANLRSGSLMTSRWLSFGRVLFSPAHNMIKSREQERILVIDGLGNDDWSFYCALTYPGASVYSLIMGPSSSPSTNPAAWEPPTNHQTVHLESMENQFPFPKRFFSVCVLRFPASCSEAAQRNIISECKRVLRPGGYLEMTVLDLDLVNMGSRTRRMMRTLKERICLADSRISLKPVSDSIQRLLGRRGFENLNRCMVSIPVARAIAGSSDSSSSGRSVATAVLSTSMGYSTQVQSTREPRVQRKSPSDDGELSLGDLLSDPSPSASNDESIAKIVAKVGRWWFSRCYEMPVLPDGDLDHSIWADKKLLRECQKRGTGFRLLIGYAQKPSEVKRRTASV